MRWWFRQQLYTQILICIVIGIALICVALQVLLLLIPPLS